MEKTSRLYYAGTQMEVMLGDVVRLKRWFHPAVAGVVCYLPGISRPHPDLENEDGKHWAIRLSDGSLCPMAFAPENPYGQPAKSIGFVRRGPLATLSDSERFY